jgi:hypothetical protein
MSLHEFMKRRRLSYRGLAKLLGLGEAPGSAKQAHRWVRGEAWPPVAIVDRVLDVTRGEVTLYALHKQRRDWLHGTGRCRKRQRTK